MGLYLWQLIGLALLLLVSFLIHLVLSRVLNPLIQRITQSKNYPSLIDEKIIWQIAKLLSIFLIVRFIKIFLPTLQLPISTAEFALAIITILSTILVLLILLKVVDVFMNYFRSFTEKTESKLDEQLIPILRRTIQAILVLIALIQIFYLLISMSQRLLQGSRLVAWLWHLLLKTP